MSNIEWILLRHSVLEILHQEISRQCSVLTRSANLIHGRSLLALGTLAMAYLVFVVKITDELKALKSIFKPAVWILELLKKIKKV